MPKAKLNKMVPPHHTTQGRGANYNAYLANPADQMKVIPPQLPEEPKGPKLLEAETLHAENTFVQRYRVALMAEHGLEQRCALSNHMTSRAQSPNC